MNETKNPDYPHYLGDVPKGSRVAMPNDFYEIEGIVEKTEMFGREGLMLDCGGILYPSSAEHCRIIDQQAAQQTAAPDPKQRHSSGSHTASTCGAVSGG